MELMGELSQTQQFSLLMRLRMMIDYVFNIYWLLSHHCSILQQTPLLQCSAQQTFSDRMASQSHIKIRRQIWPTTHYFSIQFFPAGGHPLTFFSYPLFYLYYLIRMRLPRSQHKTSLSCPLSAFNIPPSPFFSITPTPLSPKIQTNILSCPRHKAFPHPFLPWCVGRGKSPILYMIIKKMYEMKRESMYLLQGSEEEFSYSSPAAPKSIKNPHQHFQSLFVARERFCEFVNTLGQLKHSEIRDDILVHCQQNSRKERIYQSFMSDETILKIINLRIDKMIKNKRIKKNWSEEDVQILIWVISKYADKLHFVDIEKELDEEDWEAVASLIPGVTAESCMFKWLSLKKINLATNNWSEEESNLLAQLVNEKGYQGKGKDTKDWKLISQRLYFLNERDDKIFRNAKQCREHWNCYLNPNLKKGPWKPEEDIQLLKCIKQNKGSKKWSQIVKYFDGRTQNALKNRYTLIIEKQKKHNKHKNELQIIEEYLVRCYVDQFTTEIRQYSSQELNIQSSQQSLDGRKEQSSIEQHMEKPIIKIQDDFSVGVLNQAPITPVKVEKFKGFLMAMEKFDFNSILLGTLSNGVFEKTAVETDLSAASTPSKLKLKKYHSSLL